MDTPASLSRKENRDLKSVKNVVVSSSLRGVCCV